MRRGRRAKGGFFQGKSLGDGAVCSSSSSMLFVAYRNPSATSSVDVDCSSKCLGPVLLPFWSVLLNVIGLLLLLLDFLVSLTIPGMNY